ncbi:MAG: hypothetical protein WC765_08800 [Phycisphaerae bacterium]|jgi:hypothetical protein
MKTKIAVSIAILIIAWGLFGGKIFPGKTTNLPDGKALVARNDFQISENWKLPRILGKDFWLMLDPFLNRYPQYAKSGLKDEPMLKNAGILTTASWVRIVERDTANPVPGQEVPLVSTVKKLDEFIDSTHIDFSKVPLLILPSGKQAEGVWRNNIAYAKVQVDLGEYTKFKNKHQFGFMHFFPGEFDTDFYQCANWDGQWTEFRSKTGVDVVVPKPATREEALGRFRDFYTKRKAAYFGNLLDFTGVDPWDHYALEWGEADGCFMETTGYAAPSHQLQVLFCRGAARQYHTYWGWYLAYFWNAAHPVYTKAPPTNAGNYVGGQQVYPQGPYGGISTSLAMRDMYLSYLNGATFSASESWPEGFFQPTVEGDYNSTWKLSPHGETLKKWFEFTMQNPERGVSYAPIALLLDYYHGWTSSYANKHTWFYFPVDQKDNMITSFMYTLFPWIPDRADNDTRLFNSPYGDIYDALIANPPSGKLDLSPYKVAVLLGGIKVDKVLGNKLKDYVEKGGTLVINAKQVTPAISSELLGVSLSGESRPCGKGLKSLIDKETFALPGDYACETIKLNGAAPILVDENNQPIMTINNYGKGKVILTTPNWMVEKGLADARKKSPLAQFLLKHIVPDVLPFKIEGDIEYGLNRLDDGWLVYLINNKGVHKKPAEDATFDLRETSTVKISFDSKPEKIVELRESKEFPRESSVTIDVPPGDLRILKISGLPRTGSR